MEGVSNIQHIIAVDTGGTNMRMRAVIRSFTNHNFRSVILEKYYMCTEFEKIEDIFIDFISNIDSISTDENPIKTELFNACTLAIAGSRDGHKWDWIDTEELKKLLNFKYFYLINDFEANGYGVTLINEENNQNCIVLNEGKHVEKGNKLILGPGTGLGSAIISYNKAEGDYIVHPGEGGHTEYTITDMTDLKLRNFVVDYYLRNRGISLDRVSVERLTCGPAIPIIYEFFKSEYPELEVVCESDPITKEAKSIDIVNSALNNQDPLCLKVVNQFIKHLAILAGDLALITISNGGIYLAGGVAVALKDYLKTDQSNFMKILTTKGKFSEMISSMPVYLLTYDAGLDGAEQYCLQALENNYRE